MCLVILRPAFSNAQQNDIGGLGNISGKLTDSLNGQAIEYATIGLILKETNKTVNGVTSDDKGIFKISNVAEGRYNLSIYFIGYKPVTISNITINKSSLNVALGTIKLISNQTTLKEVTITTEKSLIENKIDKMVYNADKDLTSQGGVATDILKKVPQISVDVNGNVELQGNTNIRFLINGKPSSMFGNSIADVLQSIPASQIQSIEVVTIPGAKYDAEGGGIINIILKKSTAQGFSGNISVSAGTRLQNAALNLSARKGKLGINTFFSGNAQLASTTINSMTRNSQDTSLNQKSFLWQNGSSEFNRNGFQTGLNVDYAITSKDNITASFSYNYFDNVTNGINTRQSLTQNNSGNTLSDITTIVVAKNKSTTQSLDWNFNYKKTFKKEGQELEFLYNASQGNNSIYYQQTQQLNANSIPLSGTYGNNPGSDKQSNFSLNYTHPISKNFILETGAKTVLSKVGSNSDVYLLNTISNDYTLNSAQSNSLQYNRNIYGAYASGTFKLFNYLDVKAGCRYEYTETQANFSTTGDVKITPYSSIIPSAAISHTFKKNQTLKFSYAKRISRPGYRDVNPFVNASDPKNISTGNPNVSPEITELLELGYNKFFGKGSNINATLFYRGNFHDIQPYSRYYSSIKIGDSTYYNVAVSTRENIGTELNVGLNLFVSVPVTTKLTIRTNISSYQRYIQSIYPDGSIQGFMYRINVTAGYQIAKSLSAEVFGNFNSPRINVQGVQPTFTTYNIALRQFLFHKKGTVALTATNLFNKYVNQKTELIGTNFTSYNNLQLPYRSIGINFTYKFGKMEFKKQKDVEDPNLTNPPVQGN